MRLKLRFLAPIKMKKARLPNIAMLVADTVPAMIWASDTNALRTYFNRSWLEFTGKTLTEELGDGWANGIHPDDRQRCLDTFRSSVKACRSFKMEYRLRRADGQYCWVLSHGEPRFGHNGKLECYVGSCMDIGEQKAAEEALREVHEQLDARVKERTFELDRAQESLRMLSARLLQMQDDERRRIARELHDTAGQILVALNLILVPVEEELSGAVPGWSSRLGEVCVLSKNCPETCEPCLICCILRCSTRRGFTRQCVGMSRDLPREAKSTWIFSWIRGWTPARRTGNHNLPDCAGVPHQYPPSLRQQLGQHRDRPRNAQCQGRSSRPWQGNAEADSRRYRHSGHGGARATVGRTAGN